MASPPPQNVPEPSRVDELGRERAYDGFFKVDKIRVRHELFDREGRGGEPRMSPERTYEVFERGDAVGALLHDAERREVVLVNQFRLPTLNKGKGAGWLVETAAGMIRENETPERCLRREVREETGYEIRDVHKIAEFFSSPGGTSERIFLYYVQIRRTDRADAGGGNVGEGEDIVEVRMREDDFFQRIATREIQDPKAIIAGLWLKERLSRRPPPDADQSRTYRFAVRGLRGKVVGYKTGNILAVKDVDVWVNSENTNMIMDRPFGSTVSAAIRYHGARKFKDSERIQEDTISDALQRALRSRRHVGLGEVIETGAGELGGPEKARPGQLGDLLETGPGELGRRDRNNVRRIFHVATVDGLAGSNAKPQLTVLEQCVDNVLARLRLQHTASLLGRVHPYRSVLMPLFGTGDGGFSAAEVAPRLVRRAVDNLKKHGGGKPVEVYFLAYSMGDQEVMLEVFEDLCKGTDPLLERLDPPKSHNAG